MIIMVMEKVMKYDHHSPCEWTKHGASELWIRYIAERNLDEIGRPQAYS
jgi:hypothetical protein